MLEFGIGMAAMLALMFARIPIAWSMGIVGFAGLAILRGWNPALASTAISVQETGFSYQFATVPLFIMMGNFMVRSGVALDLFRAAYAFIGHQRGGLAMSTIVGCGAFGSICGSSIATAATFAKVAYPAMRRYRYSDTLATGAIAAGGTLGILIPPSTVLVIYGLMTETSISKLFAAGFLPGLLAITLLCVAVLVTVWLDPDAGPAGERSDWRQRLAAFSAVWPVLVLFLVVMGSIYAGICTATEAASVGAFGALLIAWFRGGLTFLVIRDVLWDTVITTSMLFAIVVGAMVFANYVNYTSMPSDIVDLVKSMALPPFMVVAAICAVLILLGTAMEELSMVLLTLPIFFPIITALGFDPVWFGILIVVVVEIGLISPPVGMNLFVIRSLLPHVSTRTIFIGVTPFLIADCIRLVLLVAFPAISLYLPNLLFIKP
jgi:C4-dicarboxylate transporter DctM subunit